MTASSVFYNAIPVLPALDISKSIIFYEQRLGFTKRFEFDDYAGLTRDAIEVHLWLCEDSHIPKSTSCRINVKNIEELYAEYQRVDVIHPNSKLELKPWGLKEFVVLDLNGNAIHFAEPVD